MTTNRLAWVTMTDPRTLVPQTPSSVPDLESMPRIVELPTNSAVPFPAQHRSVHARIDDADAVAARVDRSVDVSCDGSGAVHHLGQVL